MAKSTATLNLRSTTFGTQKLSPFEIVTGHSMYLAPASFNLQLVIGTIFKYYKDLIASIQNNHALVKQSFHSVLQADNPHPQHRTLQPRDFIYWKRHHKNSLQSH